jgi:hypothetical protein
VLAAVVSCDRFNYCIRRQVYLAAKLRQRSVQTARCARKVDLRIDSSSISTARARYGNDFWGSGLTP